MKYIPVKIFHHVYHLNLLPANMLSSLIIFNPNIWSLDTNTTHYSTPKSHYQQLYLRQIYT